MPTIKHSAFYIICIIFILAISVHTFFVTATDAMYGKHLKSLECVDGVFIDAIQTSVLQPDDTLLHVDKDYSDEVNVLFRKTAPLDKKNIIVGGTSSSIGSRHFRQIYGNVTQTGEGFHRFFEIDFDIDIPTDHLNTSETLQFVYVQQLPRGAYMDVDELRELHRFEPFPTITTHGDLSLISVVPKPFYMGSPNDKVSNRLESSIANIEIENPAEKSVAHTMAFLTSIKINKIRSSVKITMKLPFHLRYQRSRFNGNYSHVALPLPHLYMMDITSSSLSTDNSNWYKVNVQWKNKEKDGNPIIENNYKLIMLCVPIGNLSIAWYVTVGTYMTSIIGAVSVIYYVTFV